MLGESVDVTHELVIKLIKECREMNIDCIVSPFEADAQLSFFSLNKIVSCVITEDSDLLAYGCEKVRINRNNLKFQLFFFFMCMCALNDWHLSGYIVFRNNLFHFFTISNFGKAVMELYLTESKLEQNTLAFVPVCSIMLSLCS